jgi:type IV pilus assembly protein PilN
MVQINLLPWREQARQAKQIRFGILLAMFVVAAIMLIIGAHFYYKNLIQIQNESNAFLQSSLDASQTELATLKEKKQAQITLIAQLHYIINLRKKSYETVHLLDALAHTVPENVLLDKVIREGDVVTIAGIAQVDSEVTQFIKNIRQVNGFDQPVLTGITSIQGPNGDERHFQIKVGFK